MKVHSFEAVVEVVNFDVKVRDFSKIFSQIVDLFDKIFHSVNIIRVVNHVEISKKIQNKEKRNTRNLVWGVVLIGDKNFHASVNVSYLFTILNSVFVV